MFKKFSESFFKIQDIQKFDAFLVFSQILRTSVFRDIFE